MDSDKIRRHLLVVSLLKKRANIDAKYVNTPLTERSIRNIEYELNGALKDYHAGRVPPDGSAPTHGNPMLKDFSHVTVARSGERDVAITVHDAAPCWNCNGMGCAMCGGY